MKKKLDENSVRVIKIGKKALFEFIYPTFFIQKSREKVLCICYSKVKR